MGSKFLISIVCLGGLALQICADDPESYMKKSWYTIEMVVFEKTPTHPTSELITNAVENRVLPAKTVVMQLSDEEIARIGQNSNAVNFDAVLDELFFVNPWHVSPTIKERPSTDLENEIEPDEKYLDGCWLHLVNLEGESSTVFETHDDWSTRIANLFKESQTRDPRLPDWLPDVWQTYDQNFIDSAKTLGLCNEDVVPLFDEDYLNFMRTSAVEEADLTEVVQQVDELTSSVVQDAFDEYEAELDRTALTPQSNNLNLQQAVNRLKNNNYRIIDHFSWIQDGQERGNESDLLVQFGNYFANGFREVEGTIAFSVARFLHLKVNLWRFVSTPENYKPKETGFKSPVFFYEIQESRRLALGEVHYFDHPKFGLLVQIRRVPIPIELKELVKQLNSSS